MEILPVIQECPGHLTRAKTDLLTRSNPPQMPDVCGKVLFYTGYGNKAMDRTDRTINRRKIKVDYGKLLNRAWNVIWEHKFLILLGVLVALSSGGGGNSAASGVNLDFQSGWNEFERLPGLPPNLPDLGRKGYSLGIPLGVAVVGIGLVIGLALWVISTIARGGLIAGVNTIETGGVSGLGQALSAGWQRGWTLLGIGVVPAIPGFVLSLAGLVAFGAMAGVQRVMRDGAVFQPRSNLVVIVLALVCVAAPLMLVLSLLRTFANRACMLENLGVLASYRRGLSVLIENIGSALILFVLQIVISIGLAIVTLFPGILLALCCFLWPVFLFAQGAMAAYFMTLWTLAWREWTGLDRVGETVPAAW
jgi:hypothetical protein